ncbi:hypothetical protein [Aequorivita capsosiphonis]|nr:hypothetical protein [Aequorivita capsosiphonis]
MVRNLSGIVKYVFSNHSMLQIEIRSISMEIMHLVITDPDKIIEENDD